jgi:hypothetical protein
MCSSHGESPVLAKVEQLRDARVDGVRLVARRQRPGGCDPQLRGPEDPGTQNAALSLQFLFQRLVQGKKLASIEWGIGKLGVPSRVIRNK